MTNDDLDIRIHQVAKWLGVALALCNLTATILILSTRSHKLLVPWGIAATIASVWLALRMRMWEHRSRDWQAYVGLLNIDLVAPPSSRSASFEQLEPR